MDILSALARQLAQLTEWPLVLALIALLVALVTTVVLVMRRRYCLRLAWGNGRLELAPPRDQNPP